MTRENVKVKDGSEYDHYFPRAKMITIVKKEGATVADTLKLIPAVIRETAFHTRKFAFEVIKADTLEQTCRNIWEFVYNHIAYKKDETGKEQVRSPARAWHDRHNFEKDADGNFLKDASGNKIPMGIDCDCMTLFICSVLYNLEIKNVYFRITKYEESYWEHIYPIIKLPNGKQITIDCVLHNFDQEAKYTAKQDTPMDLEFLNGVSDSTDFMGIMDEHEALATLGKIFKKKAASRGGGGSAPAKKKGLFKKKTVEQKKARKAKVKKFIGKGLHVTNRINPVTVALRNGVLVGMKLNFLKVAEGLRWSYLTPEQAQAKGANMSKYQKLKGVREKLEKIFYGAGGKQENLKKSILTGKGNRDKAVPMNGLGYISDQNVDGLHEEMPLNELLGREIYRSENVDGMEGLNGFEGLEGFSEQGDLGSAAAASVAAASTVLTTIAALIKSIGGIFPGKAAGKKAAGGTKRSKGSASSGDSSSGGDESSGSGAGNESEGGANEESNSEAGGGEESAAKTSGGGDDNSGGDAESAGGSDEKKEEGSDEDGTTNGNDDSGSLAAKGSGLTPATLAKAKQFWEDNKKWIKPTGIAVGVLSLVYLTHRLLKSPAKKPALSLAGIGSKKKKKRKPKNILSGIKSKKGGKRPAKRNHQKKKMITLL